jgi:hypothetical protein
MLVCLKTIQNPIKKTLEKMKNKQTAIKNTLQKKGLWEFYIKNTHQTYSKGPSPMK